MFNVIVIGGGVIGGGILRELTKYNLKVCMLEKESDVSMGQSRANSGIVHAGFDAEPNTNKAKFNLLGNQMMQNYCKELGVKYINNGSLVLAFSSGELETLKELKKRGEINGVKGLELLTKEEVLALEKNVNANVEGGLLAKTGGIVCPYELTIAEIGNAMDNGAKLFTDFEVSKIQKQDNLFSVTSSNGETVKGEVIINASGLGGEKIANLIGDFSFTIGGRRGEYILLDRESGDFVSHTLFCTPTKLGKGILVTRTVDGNILLGPTAEVVNNFSVETTQNGLNTILQTANKMCKNVPTYNTITSFAGVRAFSNKNDFIIEPSKVDGNFINVVGIESPGLTSAPSIAKYVVEELVGKILTLRKNESFKGIRTPDYFFNKLSIEEKNEIIKKDKTYGKIVCRCEQITEGEIIRAIKENPPATNIDAVKRRTRAGMGRCQGGFCQPQVAEIISRELNIPLEKVTKSGKNSYLLTGVTK